MTRNEFKTENSGENQGVIVGQNSGNINVSIQKVVKIPSLIATVVKTLGEMFVQDDFSDNIGNLQEYRPDEKIEYNCVVKYKEIIKEFSAYYSICENHLNAYDDSNISGKARILKCVHLWYLQAKGEIIAENIQTGKSYIEIVRKNSDRIIDMVKIKIRDAVMGAKEFDTMYVEDIELGIECFTCFGFMECKILERPI